MNMQVQVLLIRLHQCNCHGRTIHTYECIVMKSQKSKVKSSKYFHIIIHKCVVHTENI